MALITTSALSMHEDIFIYWTYSAAWSFFESFNSFNLTHPNSDSKKTREEKSFAGFPLYSVFLYFNTLAVTLKVRWKSPVIF
jgi:hypothetical protein